jgi:hypothetical protein
MSVDTDSFRAITDTLAASGVPAALAQLVAELRRSQSFHELFDARLMEARHRLGLPLMLSTSIDDLPAEVRDPLEAAYLEACREVGQLLLAEGRFREAWMYLRPVGDKKAVAAALRMIEPTDEQVESLIEIALHEGVDPELGYQLVLERYGTCNAISLFDAAAGRLPAPQRAALAERLVRHLHAELIANVRADIARREAAGDSPAGESLKQAESATTIAELIASCDRLFADDNYHIDTSHLSAVVRNARLVTDKDVLALALDLTEYGRRLSPTYQYPGESPFEDLYPQSAQFFAAQLGKNVDEATAYFADRAAAADAQSAGTGPAETYVLLLARLQRWQEAIGASIRFLSAAGPTGGLAPSLLELARSAGDYRAVVEQSQAQGNLLTFAAGVLETERLAAGSRLKS